MRILLVALNARYVHTNLAIRYLRAALRQQSPKWEVVLKEFSINDHLEKVAAEIYEQKPDVIGFSSYIWNITQIRALLRRLRPVLPEAYFLAGGPEVSFDPVEVLEQNPQLDGIICGEAENCFPLLIQAWAEGSLPWHVPNLVWRFSKPLDPKPLAGIIPEDYRGSYKEAGQAFIFSNLPAVEPPDLNKLPDPYTEQEDLHNRLAYVETSRGCPFNCQFCISSTFQGIRYLDPEKFRLILRRLFAYGARTIKFVDRTFNARKKHAFQILDVFRQEALRLRAQSKAETYSESGQLPRAHCEMAGELLDKDWLEYLKGYPPGMIQLEIGVQSTHQPTLDAVKRPQNFAGWQDKVSYLQHICKIPIHLDLIAGLPFEGWQQFSKSFDQVFAVRPNNLQLGFLKVLKGSGIWQNSTAYGLVYSPDPPYTVLRTNELTHDHILALTRIEDILEKYYNSGRFVYSLKWLLQDEPSPFEFFHAFAEYWQKQHWFKRQWNPKGLMANLWEYLISMGASSQQRAIWREVLRFDYYLLERPGMVPVFLQPQIEGRTSACCEELEKQKERLKNNPLLKDLVPGAQDLDRRQWSRATAVEYFMVDVTEGLEDRNRLAENNELATASPVWYLFYYRGAEKQFFKLDASLAEQDCDQK